MLGIQCASIPRRIREKMFVKNINLFCCFTVDNVFYQQNNRPENRVGSLNLALATKCALV